MEIETLSVQTTVTEDARLCLRELERIARAAASGRASAAGAVAQAAVALLDCDIAVVLRPTDRPDTLAVARAFAGSEAAHAAWRFDQGALELLDHECEEGEPSGEPWSSLRARLWSLGMRSWQGVPLRREGDARTPGLLVIGSRADDRPAARGEHLTDLALSATTALATAPADCTGPAVAGDLQTVGALAFGVSHTLGNIFGAIVGNLHFLREGPDGEEASDLIDRIQASADRGAQLMRSVQQVACQPDAAAIERVDLSETAREVVALVAGLCGHWPGCRGVRIEADAGRPAPAWCDPPRLREALVNVVFNALQAVGDDGSVLVQATRGDDGGEVRVIDDGPGMTAEVRRRATEPFFTTHPDLHHGLGLSVARGTAVTHGGTLTTHLRASSGTEVALRLPKDPPARRRRAPIGASAPTAAGNRKEYVR